MHRQLEAHSTSAPAISRSNSSLFRPLFFRAALPAMLANFKKEENAKNMIPSNLLIAYFDKTYMYANPL